jgi:hypothetical protein
MKKLFILTLLLLAAPISASTSCSQYGCDIQPVLKTESATPQLSNKKKHFKAASIMLKSTVAGTLLGGLIERMFRNQVDYGLKYGALFGGLIGTRLAADLYVKQDPWLWHHIIQLAARLAERN